VGQRLLLVRVCNPLNSGVFRVRERRHNAAMEVSLNDVSAIIRLVREVCDRWDDPQAWRHRLLTGACELLGGSVGMILADYQSQGGWFGKISVVSVIGVPDSMKTMVQSAITQMDQRQIEDVSENLMPTVADHGVSLVGPGETTSGLSCAIKAATGSRDGLFEKLRKYHGRLRR
jgi:hypothetical protein